MNKHNNALWHKNHDKITKVYTRLSKKMLRLPSLRQIAAEADVNLKTAKRHIDAMLLEDITAAAKLSSPNILFAIIKKAEEGDVYAARLYFQLVFGWSEKLIGENINTNLNIDLAKFTEIGLEKLKQGEKVEEVLLDPDSIITEK